MREAKLYTKLSFLDFILAAARLVSLKSIQHYQSDQILVNHVENLSVQHSIEKFEQLKNKQIISNLNKNIWFIICDRKLG